MFDNIPILSILCYLPLFGAIPIFWMRDPAVIRKYATGVVGLDFLISLPLWFEFDRDGALFQFQEGPISFGGLDAQVEFAEQHDAQHDAQATEHPADWYPDPLGRAELRYFDGTTWTLEAPVGAMFTALRAIPPELYESARIDGCSELQIAWRIKIPLLVPALVMTTVFTMIATLQVFSEPMTLRMTMASNSAGMAKLTASGARVSCIRGRRRRRRARASSPPGR